MTLFEKREKRMTLSELSLWDYYKIFGGYFLQKIESKTVEESSWRKASTN